MSPEEYPVEQCFDTQAILIREDLISELKEKIAELETGLAEAMKVIRQNAGTISALRAENANQAAEIERLLITVREMDFYDNVIREYASCASDLQAKVAALEKIAQEEMAVR